MSVNNNKKGPVYDPGTCRCCGARKKCRLLNVEYEHAEKKEIYSDMFVECFGLVLSHLDGEPTDRLICAMCVARLREAVSFRRQVLQCEEKLLQARIHVHGEGMVYGPPPMEIKTEVIIKEEVEDDVIQCDDALEMLSDNLQQVPEPPNHGQPDQPLTVADGPSKESPEQDHERAKRQLLLRIQRMKARLKSMERASQIAKTKPQKPRDTSPADKFIDEDTLSFQNNVTIIENSYACPFQTSYSAYHCVYCQATISDPVKLREHIWSHDPKHFKTIITKKTTYLDVERIDCRLCNERINDMSAFKKHISELHGKTLNEAKDDLLRFRLRTGAIKCTECDSSFVFFHALKRHMADHFGSVVCDVCGSHHFERRALELHVRSSHGRGRHQCRECGKMFKNKHTMLTHASSVHKTEAAFQCAKCDASLFSYKDRYKHMRDAHGEALSHKCDLCTKVYTNRKNLREHNRTVHLRIFKHTCSVCGRGFAQAGRLADHVASMHRSGRSYHCDHCGNSYPRLHYLKLHIQSHSRQP